MPVPVVFLGTPPAAVTVLDALVSAGHPVILVVSRADARRGRGGAVSPSPVKSRALDLGIPVTDDLSRLRTMELPDGVIGVVVAYGRIIPVDILDRLPMLNVHFSLLPRWRGAAPVERAILEGDEETGVCIMAMEEGLDTGAVYARESVPITATTTAHELTQDLAAVGARLMCSVIAGPLPVPAPQSGEHTYASKIMPADAVIEWTESTDRTLRRVRAVTAHTFIGGKRLRVLAADRSAAEIGAGLMDDRGIVGTGDGSVRLLRVQPEGKQSMDAADWLRGLQSAFPLRLG